MSVTAAKALLESEQTKLVKVAIHEVDVFLLRCKVCTAIPIDHKVSERIIC